LSQPGRPPSPNLTTLLGIGAMLGFCIGVGGFAGVLLDGALGTSPLLALVGTAVGIVVGAAGAYQVIRPYTQGAGNKPRSTQTVDDSPTDRPDEP
jgi:F0F1-type ATP synthase assembly protein I